MTRHLPTRLAVVFVAVGITLMAAPQGRAGQGAKPAAQAASASPLMQPAAATSAPSPSPAPQGAAKPPVAKPAPAPAATSAQDGYSYRAEGRRDPFVSLLNRGSDPRQQKAEGLAGLLAGDAVLKGTLQNRGVFLGIVQGPDGKRQYIVHPNDRFADGVVKAITADSMLILQEVNDPLSLTKQREIRKTLRSVEEVK
jgi:hypothetical protein